MTATRRWRIGRYAAITLGGFLVLAAGAVVAVQRSLHHDPRAPRSDVPVVWEVDQAPDYRRLTVTGLTARVIESRLNLFNGTALVGFTLSGRMISAPGTRPRFDRVQFAERVISPPGPFPDVPNSAPLDQQTAGLEARRPHVELDVTPLSVVDTDETYHGDPVPFSVNLEKWVHTIDWGPNRYIVRAGPLEHELVLHHPK